MSEARQHHRCTSRTSKVNLALEEGGILNCVGIQPILSDNGFIRRSHLFFTCRTADKDWLRTTDYRFHQSVAVRRRVGIENSVIVENLVEDSAVRFEVLKRICDNAKHFSNPYVLWNGNRDDNAERERLASLVYFQLKYIHLCTLGGANGNFIVSTDDEVVPRLYFPRPVDRVCVPDTMLDPNVVIVGASPKCVYANPIVACPIIPREGLLDFCSDYELDVDSIRLDMTKKFPFIDRQLDWYELYKLYLDMVGVDKWYIEVFNDFGNVADYYSVIHFAKP